MSERILQVNFSAQGVADAFAEVPGLRWKTWLLDERRQEAGGIYLFEDDAALENFMYSATSSSSRCTPRSSDSP